MHSKDVTFKCPARKRLYLTETVGSQRRCNDYTSPKSKFNVFPESRGAREGTWRLSRRGRILAVVMLFEYRLRGLFLKLRLQLALTVLALLALKMRLVW